MRYFTQKMLIAASLFFLFRVDIVLSQVSDDLYKPDARLYECMDKVYLDKMSADRSDLIPYYNYYLDHSYTVVSLKAEKPVTGTDIHKVLSAESKTRPGKTFDEKQYIKEKFNPLKYIFTRSMDMYTTYVWEEAGIAIMFYPQRAFQDDFNAYLKKQKQE